MRISSLMGVLTLLCALPLAAQAPSAAAGAGSVAAYPPAPAAGAAFPRRVLAPCELTTASLGPSGEESPTGERGFAIHIMNGSAIPIDLPTYPEFGWRVESKEKNGWKLKSEGGPVRRVNPTDPHLVVAGSSGTGPMAHIAPMFSRDYHFFLPGADQALRPEGGLTVLKLSVYWAASAETKRSDPATPNCAITADWTVRMRP